MTEPAKPVTLLHALKQQKCLSWDEMAKRVTNAFAAHEPDTKKMSVSGRNLRRIALSERGPDSKPTDVTMRALQFAFGYTIDQLLAPPPVGLLLTLDTVRDYRPDGHYQSDQPGKEMPESLEDSDLRSFKLFLNTRDIMAKRAKSLISAALSLHDSNCLDAAVPLLVQDGWLPDAPIPLDEVVLNWVRSSPADHLPAALAQLIPYWPTIAGRPLTRYSTAVDRFDRPKYFFDGMSYRLLAVRTSADRTELTFTSGTYWDHYDTSEALLFEAASVWSQSLDGSIDGPYRRWLSNPFDFTRRTAIPGVNALTIRRSTTGEEPRFYLVRRGDVATAMNTLHVIPAGEFQPSRDGPLHHETELRIEATIIREYVEELLNLEETRNPDLPPVDIESNEPYRGIHQAMRSSDMQAWYLGIGLYPLTWKPEILTACVFDAEVFDDLFADMVRNGQEGELQGTETRVPALEYHVKKNRPYAGLTFNKQNVEHFGQHPSTLPAGRACLTLAWRHRERLGL
jgi:hypothetical protein